MDKPKILQPKSLVIIILTLAQIKIILQPIQTLLIALKTQPLLTPQQLIIKPNLIMNQLIIHIQILPTLIVLKPIALM